jgi:hypothetical protein
MGAAWEIEKGIPIPRRNRPGALRPPSGIIFEKMDIGDSVFLAGVGTNSRWVVVAHDVGRRLGRKFTARPASKQCGPYEATGSRVWRVA